MKKLVIITMFCLTCSITFGQTERSPYPIIFIHGITSNYKTWTEEGDNNDIYDYLINVGFVNGGNVNVMLDAIRSASTLMNTKEEDVVTLNSPFPGDLFTVNFEVHASGFVPANIENFDNEPVWIRTGISSTTQSLSVPYFQEGLYNFGDIIRIDDEFMLITNILKPDIQSYEIIVERSILGSQAVMHDMGSVIWNLSMQSNQASIAKQGWGLKQAIDLVKLVTNKTKVILVGHSMGGLAAREYIRSSYYEDDVAKLLTIGTPHLGSTVDDMNEWARVNKELDRRSDGMRDLRYTYGDDSSNPDPPFGDTPDEAIFLFSGFENYPWIPESYYSSDFNADGDEDDFIFGLGSNLSTLPDSIDYTWIVSDYFGMFGDGCVRVQRQFPWEQHEAGTENPLIEVGDTLMTAVLHGDEPQDYYSLIRGLDEPDTYELSYVLSMDRPINGFITYQSNYHLIDNDYFSVNTHSNGELSAIIDGNDTGISSLAILDAYQNVLIDSGTASLPLTLSNQGTPGTYYIRVRGAATSSSWLHPYNLELTFLETIINAAFEASPISGYAPLTVDFTDLSTTQNTSITSWEWDFDNNGTIDSYEQNPTRIFGTPGTYTVSLTVSDGLISDTETKDNYITVDPEVLPNTVQIEYFFDTDPGLGKGTSIPITSEPTVTVQTNIDVSGLPIGLHRLYIRARDEYGMWGIPQAKSVLIQSSSANDPLPNISQVEYFFDSDPGLGSGIQLSFEPDTVVNITNNLTLNLIQTGLHRLYFRAKDANNNWGIPQAKSVLIQSSSANDPLPDITQVEYFFDSDPGLGTGTQLSITPDDTVEIHTNLPCEALTLGDHIVYVRAKNENNIWGIPQYHEFTVEELIQYTDEESAVLDVPIFFNEDGDGHDVAILFTSLAGSGNVTLVQTNSAPANAPGTDIANYQYDITIDAGITGFTADMTFHYTDDEVVGYSESAAYLGMAKFNSGTNTWNWLGDAIDAENNTVTLSNVSSFSIFAFYRRLFGDVTTDGYVDAADLQRLGDCWHQTNAAEFTQGSDARFYNYNKNTFDDNQIIDAADLQVFGDCWHNGIEPGLQSDFQHIQKEKPLQKQKKIPEIKTVNN